MTFCTDGASAMVSKKNGVTGLLRKTLPCILSVHCNSHKLNLGVSDTWKGDVYLQKITSKLKLNISL